MSKRPRLFFFRHGETAWSLTGQHTGRTDLPLTPHGEQMARDLAPVLKSIRFAMVLTSPRLRARETCALAELGALAQIEPNLAEWDYGAYEGLLTVDIQRVRPGWQVWRDGCPDGETPEQVSARADQLIARLRQLEGNIALFSHGQFGRALAARWVGMPISEGRHLGLDPASISILGFETDHPDQPVISVWNAGPGGIRT
jgi:probable phosphoglycerate mutase